MKRLTIGCRARIKPQATSFSEYAGHEVILTERSGASFAVFVLGKGKNVPLTKKDKNTVINQVAWIPEKELDLVDTDFDNNLDFIDWYQGNEDNFCPDCGEWIENYDDEDTHINCPNKECPGNEMLE